MSPGNSVNKEQKPLPRPLGIGKPLLFLIAGLYILDQVTKWWVVLNMKPYQKILIDGHVYGQIDQFPVIEGFFNIVRVHNTGVAFGIGNGTVWSTYVFLAVPVLALAVLVYCFTKGKFFITPATRFCGALLIAGVLGNLTDRLVQGFMLPGAADNSFFQNLANGYVVDFLDVIVPFTNNYHWPSFNVADSCITVAAVMLFLLSFFIKEPAVKKSLPE